MTGLTFSGKFAKTDDEISAAIDDAERRLSASDAEERTYFVQKFIDAGSVLEDAVQDVSNCLAEDGF